MRMGTKNSGDGVGMGTEPMATGWGWGLSVWGWGQEPRGRLGMGTSSCPRAALYFIRAKDDGDIDEW